jgi:NPCBM/NEW2 domain
MSVTTPRPETRTTGDFMKNSTDAALIRFSSPLRILSPVVGLTLLTLSLVACGGGGTPATDAAANSDVSNVTNSDSSQLPFVYDGKDHSWSDQATGSLNIQAIANGNNALSDQAYTSASSGWGPIEKNRSNGERNNADGNIMIMDGKRYTTGLGVHSPSTITYDLNGLCTGFTTDMGVDAEVHQFGSVTFEIWADGTKLYDSNKMTGASRTQSANVNLTGKKQLKLVVTNGGDHLDYDHANWAGATLLGCTIAGSKPVIASPPVSPAPPTGNYSGPLLITKGGTYTGNWESQDAKKPAITIQTNEPVIIENSNIRGRGSLIWGSTNSLTVRNNYMYGLNANVYNWSNGHALNLNQVTNLNFYNNYVENNQGIYVNGFIGNTGRGDTIKIQRNQFKNVNGLPSNGKDGYLYGQPDMITTHAIILSNVRRIVGADISWNEIINEPGKSHVEENINMYQTSGTPNSPMLIHDNYVQGAYGSAPTTNKVYSGGGILVGDGKVSNPLDNGYVNVYNNQVVSTTNEAYAIAGGVESHYYNNRAVSSGRLPDGSRNQAQNVGLSLWDISGAAAIGTFLNNSMENNYSAWTRVNADGYTWTNAMWLPECGKHGTVCNNNKDGGKATLDDEKKEYQLWLSKVASNNVKIGK